MPARSGESRRSTRTGWTETAQRSAGDEGGGGGRHSDLHWHLPRAAGGQVYGNFVGGDTAGDAQQNAFMGEVAAWKPAQMGEMAASLT